MRSVWFNIYSSLALVSVLALPACTSAGSSTIGRSALNVAHESQEEGGRKYTIGPQFESQLEHMISREVVALGGKENVPMELNREVLLNINYFLNDGRGFITRGLGRGSKYIPMMKAIFRQKGLPEDLVYLALIESGFRNTAVSHASAVGPWQFITATGRRYGLTINEWVDERMDPVKATYAAADYLKALHDMFNSWPLAIAAYNSGEGKIMKGMKNYGVRDFWDMSGSVDHLAAETKLYVPSFLAVTFIAKDPAAYGLSIDTQPADQWEEVVVPAQVSLKDAAKFSGTNVETLKELNPHLKKDATPPNESNFVLRLPVGTTEKFAKAYGQSGKGGKAYASSGITPGQHVVKKGETVATVAALYGVDPAELKKQNKLSGDKLKVGAKLVVPDPTLSGGSSPAPRVAQSARPQNNTTAVTSEPRLANISHKVKPGDTLSSVANLYGVSAESIKKSNNLSSNFIREGQILKIKSDIPLTAQKKTESSPVMVVETTPAPASAPPKTAQHTVAAGETVGAIAKKYGLSAKELMEMNKLSSHNLRIGQKLKVKGEAKSEAVARRTETSPAVASAASVGGVHVVAAGESLGVIAEKYGLKTKELMELNGLNDHKLSIGQKLKVPQGSGQKVAAKSPQPASDQKPITSSSAQSAPSGGVHVVASGENLGLIAAKYGLKTQELMDLNGLTGHSLRVGQKLNVSKAAARPMAAAAKPEATTSAPAASTPGLHVVAGGENLGGIAKKYGLSVKELMDLNNMAGPDLKIGQKLKVAGSKASASQAATPKPQPSEIKKAETPKPQPTETAKAEAPKDAVSENKKIEPPKALASQSVKGEVKSSGESSPVAKGNLGGSTHKVAEGDTLYNIARRNNISVEELMKLNGLENNTVKVGQTIKVK